MNENLDIIAVLSGIIAFMMLIAIFNMPYGYYVFLRILVFILGGVIVYNVYQISEFESIIIWGFVMMIIVWNPLIPFYMSRETWFFFNFAAMIYCAYVSYSANLGNDFK